MTLLSSKFRIGCTPAIIVVTPAGKLQQVALPVSDIMYVIADQPAAGTILMLQGSRHLDVWDREALLFRFERKVLQTINLRPDDHNLNPGNQIGISTNGDVIWCKPAGDVTIYKITEGMQRIATLRLPFCSNLFFSPDASRWAAVSAHKYSDKQVLSVYALPATQLTVYETTRDARLMSLQFSPDNAIIVTLYNECSSFCFHCDFKTRKRYTDGPLAAGIFVDKVYVTITRELRVQLWDLRLFTSLGSLKLKITSVPRYILTVSGRHIKLICDGEFSVILEQAPFGLVGSNRLVVAACAVCGDQRRRVKKLPTELWDLIVNEFLC
jgi:hypothetical protein